jgi:hypothetical protein
MQVQAGTQALQEAQAALQLRFFFGVMKPCCARSSQESAVACRTGNPEDGLQIAQAPRALPCSWVPGCRVNPGSAVALLLFHLLGFEESSADQDLLELAQTSWNSSLAAGKQACFEQGGLNRQIAAAACEHSATVRTLGAISRPMS